MDVRPHISLRQARRQIRLKQPALWDAAFVDDPGERVRRAVEFEMLKNGVGERDALAAVQLRLNTSTTRWACCFLPRSQVHRTESHPPFQPTRTDCIVERTQRSSAIESACNHTQALHRNGPRFLRQPYAGNSAHGNRQSGWLEICLSSHAPLRQPKKRKTCFPSSDSRWNQR